MEVGLEHAPGERGLIGDGQPLVSSLQTVTWPTSMPLAVTRSVRNGSSQVCAAASLGQSAGQQGQGERPGGDVAAVDAVLCHGRLSSWRPSAAEQKRALRSDRLGPVPEVVQICAMICWPGPRSLLPLCHMVAR